MASLAESQRQMAEALPGVIWTATADGEIDYANGYFLEYTGTPAEESAGGGWLNALHPDDVAPTLALWRRCVASLSPYQTEFRFLHRASNTWRWHHVAARPFINESGEVVRWYGITTDIHDTRLAQQAVGEAHRDLHWMLELQSLESRVLESISAAQGLDTILETITQGVQNLAPGTRCAIHLASRVMPGPSAARPAGLATPGPLPPPVDDLAITDAHGRPLATLQLGNLAANTDKRFRVLTERAGQLVRVAIERTRQREQLQESEIRFRAVAQASGDVLWDCDLATDAVWYSDGMARLFGRQAETDPALHRGRDANRYIHPDDRERVLAHMAHATAHENQWQLEYRYQKADGSYAHVVNRAVVLRHPDGTAHRILGSITDVTRQKLLEEQLYRSQRLEAVGELTGGLAHDFNNLLTIILGNVDQIADEAPEGSEHRQLALDAKAAARKGAGLIRNLLAFSRQQVLMARPVHVNSLVTGMQALLRNALGDLTTLRFELSGSNWTVLVDPGQLETALLNLAFNARDAMPGGGELVLRTYQARVDESTHPDPELQTGAYTVLEVSDTGCGIEPATLQHVFEPFFTTKDTGKGNGLGLSMVYGFVKQSQGHVSIDSRPGEGTTVRLYFPCHEQAASPEPAPSGTPRHQGLPQGAEAVLVVEDDPIVLQFLAGQLRRLGYDVASATTGPEALELLASRPDTRLLFTDMMLPGGMDGLELARTACEQRPHLAVLISSGYSNEHFVNADRTPEGYWLLAKPYLRADLAMRVRQALSGAD